jgi:hypothetical protein
MNYNVFWYLNSTKVMTTTEENRIINNEEKRRDWYNTQ